MAYQKPKGTRDIYGHDLARIETVCHNARTFFGKNGYMEIRTPVFEYAELFIRSIGQHTDIVEKENYTFEINERTYMLRPEGTASVLRSIIENHIPVPQRFLYIEPMFRRERPQKGRYREFIQIGIEHVGEIAPVFDAELIEQGKTFLNSIGCEGFTIEINSIGCPQCRLEYKKLLRENLQSRSTQLCDDCVRRMESNFLRLFDCKNVQCQCIYDEVPKITDHLCGKCAEHYQRVKHYLEIMDVPVSENKKMVRGLDYYTRTVFEFKAGVLGAQDTILAGGRYDILMQELGGQDTPALGWAMGVDRMLIALPDDLPVVPRQKVVYIIAMGEEYVSDMLRVRTQVQTCGHVCMIGNPDAPIKKQMKQANRSHADYVFIYGEQESKDQTVTVKNMEKGDQRSVPIDALGDFLKTLNAKR
jgi:histidyl-tRNA synthetase